MTAIDTSGVTSKGGRAQPAPPLPIRGIASVAIAGSVLSAFFGLFAASMFGRSNPVLAMLAYPVLLALAAAHLVPLVLMWRRASASGRLWRGGQWVRAREEAAHARELGVTVAGIALISILALTVVIFVCANDDAVQRTFFDPEIIATSFVEVTKALGVNILIAVCSMALAIVVGLALAIMRLLPGRGMRALRMISIAIIDIFRSLPAVVVIYLVCFGLPLTKIPVISQQDPILYAILALTLVYAAYLAELFRSGIEAIHDSQHSAALSLGLGTASVYRRVIIPQMARNIAPPLLGYFIGLQKDTALVNVVGIIDAFTQAKIYSSNYYNLSSVTVVCILFIILTIPQTRFVDYLIARSDSKKAR